MNATIDNAAPPVSRFWRVFLALMALGMLGVFSLIPTIMGQLEQLQPELADMPTAVLVLISLLNSAILLAVAVAVGALTAHRVGLRSFVAERVSGGAAVWPQLRPHIPFAIVAGLIFGFVVLGLDALIDPFANAEFLAEMPGAGNPIPQLILGLLYGGITEELLLRWGFMSLLVWIGWWLFQRGQGSPGPALVWTAIIVAAILFGLGHLPALSQLVVLTPLLVIRTVLLNALGGLLFGWLFWRRGLETAMVAHAFAHVAFFIINVIGINSV
jgi:membrane protease YdiL (CAAX protease family)